MKEAIAFLGFKVRDRVTGFVGVVTSISFDLYGCIQAIVSPVVTTEKPNEIADSRWFDVKRLECLEDKPVMEAQSFDGWTPQAVRGPADKPRMEGQPLP